MANMKEAMKHLIALTPEKEELFYKILEEGGGYIANACKALGISRNTYINHYKRNPSFGIKCNKIIAKVKLLKVRKKPQKIVLVKEKKESGRPTIMSESTLAKLKEGFAHGFSVRNACIWADISQDTYFNYCKKHREFSDQCKTLQQKPAIKAVLVINKALNEGDVNTAKWYAERKLKEEFTTRQELTGINGERLAPPQIIISTKPFKKE